MLADPNRAETAVLGAIPYQRNEAVLHTDATLMPRRRAAWASWNYHLADRPTGRTTVTYHMNRLQSLEAGSDFFVSLNRSDAIDPDAVIRTIGYSHPGLHSGGNRRSGPLGGDLRRADPLLRRLLALGVPRGWGLVCAARGREARSAWSTSRSRTTPHRRLSSQSAIPAALAEAA